MIYSHFEVFFTKGNIYFIFFSSSGSNFCLTGLGKIFVTSYSLIIIKNTNARVIDEIEFLSYQLILWSDQTMAGPMPGSRMTHVALGTHVLFFITFLINLCIHSKTT